LDNLGRLRIIIDNVKDQPAGLSAENPIVKAAPGLAVPAGDRMATTSNAKYVSPKPELLAGLFSNILTFI
jgi:hypothetical protein